MGLALRDYQEDSLSAVAGASEMRQLVALPTGSGKTVVFAELLRRRGGRGLVLCHRDELIAQAVEKIRMAWPEARVGVVKAERDERDAQVVVASVQTVASERRALGPDFDTVIVDEAHHAAADSWQKVLRGVGAWDGVLTVGFTATPERADKRALGAFWQRIVFSRTLFQMIQTGWLCDLRAKRVGIGVDLGGVTVRHGDWTDGSLGAAMAAAGAPARVAEAWVRWGEGRKSLCYAPTVAIAQEIEEELRRRGVRAASVWGAQALDARRAVLAAYAEGKFQVVTNCGVLLEGYDDPPTACIVMARPTKSRVLYQQAIGRGTRTWLGKPDCLVLDCVGASEEHDLMTMASLLGITEASAERGVLATLRAAAEGAPDLAGELTATDVKLFDRSSLHWVVDGRRFLLPGGGFTLSVEQRGVAWRVVLIPREWREANTVLVDDLTMEYAHGFAEDYVRSHGGMAIARATAGWRSRPATDYPKMEKTLRKWGKWKSDLTAGQASDLISIGIVARR